MAETGQHDEWRLAAAVPLEIWNLPNRAQLENVDAIPRTADTRDGGAKSVGLKLHQAVGGKADHLVQEIGIGGLLKQRLQLHLLVGRCGSSFGQVLSVATQPYREPAMAASPAALRKLHHVRGRYPPDQARCLSRRPRVVQHPRPRGGPILGVPEGGVLLVCPLHVGDDLTLRVEERGCVATHVVLKPAVFSRHARKIADQLPDKIGGHEELQAVAPRRAFLGIQKSLAQDRRKHS
jgi:hypothetical protein